MIHKIHFESQIWALFDEISFIVITTFMKFHNQNDILDIKSTSVLSCHEMRDQIRQNCPLCAAKFLMSYVLACIVYSALCPTSPLLCLIKFKFSSKLHT